jgi:hypothetical protein
MTGQERDFPPGHPKAADYDPASPDAKEWLRMHFFPLGERDFPPDHPKALDTPGNTNALVWEPGVDPLHPELEPFTGATPEQVAARKAAEDAARSAALPTPVVEPGIAPDPPLPQ